MASCPDETTILALVEGKLSRLLATPVQRHIERCRSCQIASAEAARTLAVPDRDRLEEPEAEPFRSSLLLDDRYLLEAVIGRGGVGEVWAARRTTDQQPVAIKRLRSPQPDLVRRLQREARLAQQLTHPSFVPVHEVLVVEDRPVLVMDLLQGEDLACFLEREKKLEWREAVAILTPISDALVALHDTQIAHRDLKPGNIFLEHPRTVRILDLGMARSLDLERATMNASRLTSDGTVLGTPRYMAPEQLEAASEVDTRADIWALGAIAYLMLSGRGHVSVWRFADVLRSLHTEPIAPIAALVPELPAPLVQLVALSLSIAPERRPSAGAWHATLCTLRGSA